MNRSESISNLTAALAKFQASIGPINKGRTAKAGSYSYTYADLADIMDAIRKPLADCKLAILQSVGGDGAYISITTTLTHESGEWVESDMLLMPAGNTPQTAGSAATYGRRYSLSAVLGIVTEDDDDGAAATHAPASSAFEDKASEGQVKMIFGVSKSVGWSHEHLMETLAKKFGPDTHPADLTKSQARQVIDGLKKLESKEA